MISQVIPTTGAWINYQYSMITLNSPENSRELLANKKIIVGGEVIFGRTERMKEDGGNFCF
jgi:hypothetical protein